jgi:hypothetical protein
MEVAGLGSEPAAHSRSVIGNMLQFIGSSVVFPGQPLGSSKQGAGVYTDGNGAARASLIGLFKDNVCDLPSANRRPVLIGLKGRDDPQVTACECSCGELDHSGHCHSTELATGHHLHHGRRRRPASSWRRLYRRHTLSGCQGY